MRITVPAVLCFFFSPLLTVRRKRLEELNLADNEITSVLHIDDLPSLSRLVLGMSPVYYLHFCFANLSKMAIFSARFLERTLTQPCQACRYRAIDWTISTLPATQTCAISMSTGTAYTQYKEYKSFDDSILYRCASKLLLNLRASSQFLSNKSMLGRCISLPTPFQSSNCLISTTASKIWS